MSEYIKVTLERTRSKNISLLSNLFSEYERYLKMNDYSILKLTALLDNYSKENTGWVNTLFANLIDLDIQLSYCLNSLDLLSELVLENLTRDYLHFNRADLVKVFSFKSRLKTERAVPKETINSLSINSEKSLVKDTTDYRFMRLFCICSILGLYNTTCLLSSFALRQFELSELKDKGL